MIVKSRLDPLLLLYLKENIAAAECYALICRILHFWDDLIDRDKLVSQMEINVGMFNSLIELPSNKFYRDNQSSLQPVLVNAIANWQTANEFESNGVKKELELAFVIRSDYCNILIQMAYIVGGHDWVMEITPKIRANWTDEDFAMYLDGLELEKVLRSKNVSAETIADVEAIAR